MSIISAICLLKLIRAAQSKPYIRVLQGFAILGIALPGYLYDMGHYFQTDLGCKIEKNLFVDLMSLIIYRSNL